MMRAQTLGLKPLDTVNTQRHLQEPMHPGKLHQDSDVSTQMWPIKHTMHDMYYWLQ